MVIDHVGYAVSDIDKAIVDMESLGFQFGDAIDDDSRNVVLAFGNNGGYTVELVCPKDTSKKSPVDLYLSKVRSGPYHICYRTDDFEGSLSMLQAQGFRVAIPPQPAVAFNGRHVVFLYSLRSGLIELLEQ